MIKSKRIVRWIWGNAAQAAKKIMLASSLTAVTFLVTNCTGDFTVTYLTTTEGDNYASQKDVPSQLPQELQTRDSDLVPE